MSPWSPPGEQALTDDPFAAHRAAVRDEILKSWRAQLEKLPEALLPAFAGELDARLAERFAEIARMWAEQMARHVLLAREEAAGAARQRLSEEYNQAFRRLRQAQSPEDVSRWLAETTRPLCPRGGVFGVNGVFLQGLRLNGVEAQPAIDLFEKLEIPLSQAPLFAHCVAEREPIAGVAAPEEVSPAVMAIFRHQRGERVMLFPLVVKGDVAAVFYAAGSADRIDPAPLELLAQAAAVVAESMVPGRRLPEPPPEEEPVRVAPPELVQIQGFGEPASPRGPRLMPDWDDLGRDDQELHLMARRFARVQVAEMRLYHGELVESGRMTRRLYVALRETVDRARDEYRQKFLNTSPTMVDYLHLELVRSLAHDNAALLGRDYPGPLV